MNEEREQIIREAAAEFCRTEAQLLAALRRVAVDTALADEGMPRMTDDEGARLDRDCSRINLSGCSSGETCRRCSGD